MMNDLGTSHLGTPDLYLALWYIFSGRHRGRVILSMCRRIFNNDVDGGVWPMMARMPHLPVGCE